jgi:hypothetical protein
VSRWAACLFVLFDGVPVRRRELVVRRWSRGRRCARCCAVS